MTDDSRTSELTKAEGAPRKRTRKPGKKASADGPPIMAQAANEDVGSGTALRVKTKRTSRPRTRKPVTEALVDVIGPDEPIVSGKTPSIPLAVPVGAPFAPSSATPARRSAITSDIAELRSSMLVPVAYDPPQQPAWFWQWRESLAKAGRMLSPALDVLRRHPRASSLVTTALLLGVSLAAMITVSDMTEPQETERKIEDRFSLAAVPSNDPLTLLADEAAPGPAEVIDPLASIRIVDPSWDRKLSCTEGTWPYIEQRCLLRDESDANVENKIGPRMIDSRTRATTPEAAGPIGSITAIVPASPRAQSTDGVATPEIDLDQYEEVSPGSEPVATAVPITDMRSIPPQAMESRADVRSARLRSSRTFRLSEDTKPVPRRTASVKKKRQPSVVDAGRRARAPAVNQAQTPQFFFPFGWFVQAR